MYKRQLILAAACAAAILQSTALATVTINGSYDADYGAPLSLQTNNTGFADNTNTDGNTANGSELDAAYATVQNGTLYLFFAGNLSTDFTHLNLFIADGRSGQSTLNASSAGGGALHHMNGSKFSPGFVGTYALDINGGSTPTTFFANKYDLTQPTAPGSFIGSFNPTLGTQSEFISSGVHSNIFASFDNSNTAGVNGNTGTTTLGADPAAVTTGLELSIPLTQLGSPQGTTLKILADINGNNGNGFLSNQFLPGLPAGSGNLGGSGGNSMFDFSGTPNMFFTVNVPAGTNTNAVWTNTGTGSWGAASNWSTTPIIPSAPGDSATFGGTTGPRTVTLDGNRTVGRISFNNPNSYTIASGTPGSTLIIDDTGDSGGVNPLLSADSGIHLISAPVQLANGVTITGNNNQGLIISGNVSGAGPIIKDGGAFLVLQGSNSYSGNTTILQGSIELDHNQAASAGTIFLGDETADAVAVNLNIGQSGMNISNPITTNKDLAATNDSRLISALFSGGSATVSSTITVNGGIRLRSNLFTTLNVTGVIQDGTDTHPSARHAIRIDGGSGTVVLSNNETATGDTFVDSGTLVLASGASLSSGSLNVFTGAYASINGTLPSTVKLYTSGELHFPGNTSLSAATLNTSTISVDSAGLMQIAPSVSSASPIVVNAGSVEFLGDFTGKIDLTNNQLITTNSATTTRDQLHAANIITSITGGTLGYKDTGGGTTQIQFAVRGDATLDGVTNSADFNQLALNFNQTDKLWVDGDFNYDGTVNALDFNELASHYGQTLASPALGALVPEPSTMTLIAFTAIALRRRRR